MKEDIKSKTNWVGFELYFRIGSDGRKYMSIVSFIFLTIKIV
jgi:hypothetical protein